MKDKNPQLENGYLKLAIELVEALGRAMPGFTEGQIIWCILRKTYGWHKKSDKISISQLVEMTGKSKRMVIYALQNLEAKNMIFISRSFQNTNEITFNKKFDEWVMQKVAPQYKKLHLVQHPIKSLPKVAHTKDTNTKDNTSGGILPPTPPSLSLEEFLVDFNSKFDSNYRLTNGRAEKLRTRLKKYTPAQIKQALKNLSLSPFHKGKNDRGWVADPDFLIRNDEQIDKWLNKKPEQEIKQKQSGFQNIRDWQENNPELVAQMERDAQFRQKRMEERMKEIEEERKKNEPS